MLVTAEMLRGQGCPNVVGLPTPAHLVNGTAVVAASRKYNDWDELRSTSWFKDAQTGMLLLLCESLERPGRSPCSIDQCCGDDTNLVVRLFDIRSADGGGGLGEDDVLGYRRNNPTLKTLSDRLTSAELGLELIQKSVDCLTTKVNTPPASETKYHDVSSAMSDFVIAPRVIKDVWLKHNESRTLIGEVSVCDATRWHIKPYGCGVGPLMHGELDKVYDSEEAAILGLQAVWNKYHGQWLPADGLEFSNRDLCDVWMLVRGSKVFIGRVEEICLNRWVIYLQGKVYPPEDGTFPSRVAAADALRELWNRSRRAGQPYKDNSDWRYNNDSHFRWTT